MGIFAGIDKADASIQANYERPGHYLELIEKCKVGERRNGEKFFVVVKKIVHVFDNDAGKGHAVMDVVDHMMLKRHESFLGNVKQFVQAVLGVQGDDVTEGLMETICDLEAQPLSGLVVECNNRIIMTRANQPFNKINYIRRWSSEELRKTLSDDVKRLAFNDGADLDIMAEREAAE